MIKKPLFLACLILAALAVYPLETGIPFMTVYTAKETGGHVQNWEFLQDERGLMYVGNGYGVQEFDGSSWRLIQNTNRSLARALAQDGSGRIYVGGGAELGYIEPDGSGAMRYVSLLDAIADEDRAFTTVLSIHCTPEGIYFQSIERLFRFRLIAAPGAVAGAPPRWEVKAWRAAVSFRRGSWLENAYHVFKSGEGLFKLQDDSLRLVPGSELLKEMRITFFFPFPGRPHVYILGTMDGRLFLWDGRAFAPWKTEADALLRGFRLYCGVPLPDGSITLGSLGNGLIILGSDGKVRAHFTNESGLISTTIEALYLDRQGNLWVGMDGGIAVLELDSPFSHVTMSLGTGANSLFRHRGRLYAASNSGLFFLDRDSGFKRLGSEAGSNTQQFFQILAIEGELFVCGSNGIFLIENDRTRLVFASLAGASGVVSLHPCRNDPRTFLAGSTDGVLIFRYDPGDPRRLRFLGRIADIHEYVHTIAEPEPGVFWFGTFDEGVLRIKAPDGRFNEAAIERFGPAQNLPPGTALAFEAAGHLCFTTMNGVYRFDDGLHRFEPDPLFAGVAVGRNVAEGVIVGGPGGSIWANLGGESGVLQRSADGSYRLQKHLLSRFGSEPVFAILPEEDGAVWFAVVNHVFRYLPRARASEVLPGASLMRAVTLADGATVAMAGAAGGPAAELPFKRNELHFEFALPSFIDPRANEFQSKLDGFDDSWSGWSRENKRYYTNLAPGRYRFLVRARNILGQASAPAGFAFAILAPWYRTPAANIAYGLLALLMILGFVRLRTRSLQEKSKALEKVVRERTSEIQTQKENVEQLSVIGRDITDNLSIKGIIDTAYENVNTLMDASVFGIGLHSAEKQALVFPATREKGLSLEEFSVPLADDDRLAVWCFKNRKDVVINDYGKEYDKYIRQIKAPAAGENPEAILYLPLQHKDKTIGVITAQSFSKNAFSDYHLNILRNLATYSAIALDNADAYRRVNELLNDLKGTQEKLVTQSKLAALGALTAGIAHEIKNPLNFINNFAELTADLVVELRQEIEKNAARLAPGDRKTIEETLATIQDNAGKIKEHGKRADSIVKSMLQHSRGKAGEKQSTDINAMLAEDVNLAYHGMRAQDSSFNVTIETEFDPAVGRIEVVPQDISRVFLNIISNACYEANRRKTTAGPGFSPTLTVRSRKLKDGVEVRVRDNGNGIPLAVRDKLFTPFFTTKPTGQGTGLGLSISHDIIVQGHNGQITFESKEGQYTEFVIVLPQK